jgi:hypothetical protein
VALDRLQRHHRRAQLGDAHLHVAAQRDGHRQRLPEHEHRVGRARLGVEVERVGGDVGEARAEAAEERARVERRAGEVGPEALVVQGARALVGQLLGERVEQLAQPVVERAWA